MRTNAWVRILLFGVATWLMPFLVSFLFYKPGGELAVSIGLFKSVMILVGSGVGLYLLYRLYRNGRPVAHAGVLIGLAWFAINVALDLLALLPLTGLPFGVWASEIGLRYLLIPMICITVDNVARG